MAGHALMGAAFKGHTETVKALLGVGADVNAKGLDGWTTLAVAASKGHAETVRILKQAGARK